MVDGFGGKERRKKLVLNRLQVNLDLYRNRNPKFRITPDS